MKTPTVTPTPTNTSAVSSSPSVTLTPTATSTSVSFPSTGILDNFNRSNGGIGSNWGGATGGYSIKNNKLDVGSGGDIYWSANAFGPSQEAYLKLATVDNNGGEQDLILKAQCNTGYTCGVLAIRRLLLQNIRTCNTANCLSDWLNEQASKASLLTANHSEVWYDAPSQKVKVLTYESSQGWVQQGADISLSFANGDILGARATASGQVSVYKNGALQATREITAWPYYDDGGYIGVWFANAGSAYGDDFGGGSMPGSSLMGKNVRASLVKVAKRKGTLQKAQTLQPPPAGQVWRSYYFSGGARIAMRAQVNGAADKVYYLLTDHLGSTTVSYRSDGLDTRTQSYKPWGELRPGPGTSLPTDRTFTGQRWEEVGLYYFNARWYDSSLGRFAQADAFVPGGVQGLDRYAYTANNPVKYIDPSGHEICDADGNCGDYHSTQNYINKPDAEKYWKDMLENKFGVNIIEGTKEWGAANLRTIYYGLSKIIRTLGEGLKSFTGISFRIGEHVREGPEDKTTYNGEVSGLTATFYTTGNETIRTHHFYHESGHVYDNFSGEAYVTQLGSHPYYVGDKYVFGGEDVNNINPDALRSFTINGTEAIQHASPDPGEQWADIFANYMSNNIDASSRNPMGQMMYQWISSVLPSFP